MVVVYSKPACVACNRTKKRLERNGTVFKEVDVTQDIEALKGLQDLGYKALPVVITPGASWCGYRPDEIDNLSS